MIFFRRWLRVRIHRCYRNVWIKQADQNINECVNGVFCKDVTSWCSHKNFKGCDESITWTFKEPFKSPSSTTVDKFDCDRRCNDYGIEKTALRSDCYNSYVISWRRRWESMEPIYSSKMLPIRLLVEGMLKNMFISYHLFRTTWLHNIPIKADNTLFQTNSYTGWIWEKCNVLSDSLNKLFCILKK